MIKSTVVNRPRVWLMRTSPRLYVVLARLAAKGMFRKERRALRGRLAVTGSEPSVLHFCYNRCGSRHVSALIQRLLAPAGHVHLDYDRYYAHCWREGVAQMQDPSFLMPRLAKTGMHYGPFYRLHDGFAELDGFRIVLTLRDPRDVLTSRFYSQAFAHTLLDKESIARRERFRDMGVDAFVLDQADEIIDRYAAYHERLVGRANVLFLPYEEMVGDFDRWLEPLAAFLGAGDQREVIEAIRAEADFSVKREDKFSHRRSVRPGNHAEKLQPATVAELNERLRGVLDMFGYSTADAAASESR